MLAALALAREADAPVLGCLLGLTGTAPADEAGRTVRVSPATTGPTGPAELGVLADMSIGSALRARVGLDHRLATVSLTVELTSALPPAAELSMHSRYVAESGRSLLGTGTLWSGSSAIGAGLATFSSRERGAALLPWEPSAATSLPDSPVPLRESDLDTDEAAVLRAVTGSELAPVTALLEAAVAESRNGRMVLRPRPALANRAGAVQGGVLIGLAGTAAAPAVPAELLALHIDYVAPALIGDEVVAESTDLGGGARTRSVRVDLRQGGTLVAVATVRHRRK